MNLKNIIKTWISFEMNVLIVDKSLIQRSINMMWLIWIQCPSCFKLEILLFHFIPCVLLHHKLSCYFIPSLFPINSCIQYQNCYLINSSVHSYQSEPAAFHWSEFIIVNNKSVIIKLILIKWTLVVKLNRILRTKFMDRNYVFFCSFNLYLSLNMTLKRWNEETIWTLLDFADFDIFRSC